MNVHTGETPSGNPFYIMPDRTGFHVNIHVDDCVYYDFVTGSSMEPDAVRDIVTELEALHVREGKQIEAVSDTTE